MRTVLPIANRIILLWVIAAAPLLGGCTRELRLQENAKSGVELVKALRVYNDLGSDDRFPTNLHELVSSGLMKTLPKCRCADGELRDFVYVPGLLLIDSERAVILISPSEMDPESAIMFDVGMTARVVTREKAEREAEKSRSLVKQRIEARQVGESGAVEE